MLKITQLNILASIWLTDEYKLLPCYPIYNSQMRLEITLNYLKRQDSNLYFLSEVLSSQLSRIKQVFPEYTCLFSSNDPVFWKEWLGDREWKSNGTCILFKGKIDDYGSYNLGDGCRCTCARIEKVILVSVHFDTENKKYLETKSLLSLLAGSRDCTIVISGDYNFTNLSLFLNQGYQELFRKERYSTPLHEGVIDHTLVYSPLKIRCGGRIDTLKDLSKEDLVNKGLQLCKTAMINGSDHYCTNGFIEFLQ